MARTRSTAWWRRELKWAIPFVVGAVTYVICLRLVEDAAPTASADPADAGPVVALSLAVLGGGALAVVTGVIGVIRLVVLGIRYLRHKAGLYTKKEIATQSQADYREHAWRRSRSLRAQLARREVPPAITVWDVVPMQGEVFFLDRSAHYARYYGQDVYYSTQGGFFFGHPLFVAAGLGLTAAINSSRRSQAQAAAREQWREEQWVRVVVSNQRVLCLVGGQWLSFFYGGMTAVYPEVGQWTLICQFSDTSPMLLSGPDVPEIALMTVLMTHGPEALEQHPSLAPLR